MIFPAWWTWASVDGAWPSRCLGVNMNFAPVLDICHDPGAANALPGRCWGNNAQDVISYAGVYSSNLRRGGIQSCGKHFPGMGRARGPPFQPSGS